MARSGCWPPCWSSAARSAGEAPAISRHCRFLCFHCRSVPNSMAPSACTAFPCVFTACRRFTSWRLQDRRDPPPRQHPRAALLHRRRRPARDRRRNGQDAARGECARRRVAMVGHGRGTAECVRHPVGGGWLRDSHGRTRHRAAVPASCTDIPLSQCVLRPLCASANPDQVCLHMNDDTDTGGSAGDAAGAGGHQRWCGSGAGASARTPNQLVSLGGL